MGCRRLMAVVLAGVVVGVCGAGAWGAEADGAGDKVTVRVVEKTYPVKPSTRKMPRFPPTAKFAGKTEYTTKAVVLENAHLRLTVLPEFGGRLVGAVRKAGGKETEMFWINDEFYDDVSWSMSGNRVSFPFWEHGRHWDEEAGYTTVTGEDGSVTLALDMRFDQFVKKEETVRYGRATNLRLAQFFTLKPDEAVFTWRTKVDNPLPVQYGFKLWTLLRQPNTAGIEVILPTAAYTDHGGPSLKKWEPATVGTLNFSRFAIGMQHDFAGWYLPQRQMTVLTIRDHKVVPGAKQVLYPSKAEGKGYIELWHGNHELFEETGRLLPALGSYELTLRVAGVMTEEGLGAVTFASGHAALWAKKMEGGWDMVFRPYAAADGVAVQWRGPEREAWTTVGQKVDLRVGKPLRVALTQAPEQVRVRLVAADGKTVLLETALPVEMGEMPEAQFAQVQALVKGSMPGGQGLYAEGQDLVTETQMNLVRYAGTAGKVLKESEDAGEIVAAARRLWRARKEVPEAIAALEKVAARKPAEVGESIHATARLYLGMMHLEAGQVKEAQAALAGLETPAARYLRGLIAVRGKAYAAGVAELEKMGEAQAAVDVAGSPDAALLQEGAYVGNVQGRLLLAIAQQGLGKKAEAEATLKGLLKDDPALIEAWVLLEGTAPATLTEGNEAGMRAAGRNLAGLRAGIFRGPLRP